MSDTPHCVQELVDQVTTNPYLQESYPSLLDHYQDCCDNEKICESATQQKLEDCRVKYALCCNPPASFWVSWLSDCVIVASENISFVPKIEELFTTAMRQAPHHSIVTEYLDAMQSFYDKEVISDTQMRDAFERAVQYVGCDMANGNAVVWSRYRAFELDETQDAMELATDEASVLEAKLRLIGLYKRNLRLPMTDSDAVLGELDRTLGDVCSESDVTLTSPMGVALSSIPQACSTSEEMKADRVKFEELVSQEGGYGSDSCTKAHLHSWKAYIAFEVQDNQPSRAQRLYERALLDCCFSLPGSEGQEGADEEEICAFIEEYLFFAANILKDYSLLESISLRATKNLCCWGSLTVWRMAFLAMEATGAYTHSFSLPAVLNMVPHDSSSNGSGKGDVIGPAVPERFQRGEGDTLGNSSGEAESIPISQATLQRAMLCCRFPPERSYQYVSLLMMYCDIYRHQLSKAVREDLGQTETLRLVRQLRAAFTVATRYMEAYFGAWAEGWLSWVSYKAKIEDTLIEDVCSMLVEEGEGDTDRALESLALEEYEALLEKFCSNEQDSASNVGLWLHYLSFITEESCTRDLSFCRKVYRRAVTLSTAAIMQAQSSSGSGTFLAAYPPFSSPGDLLYAHWQAFEERHGDAKDVLGVMSRHRKYSLKLETIISAEAKRTEKMSKKECKENKKRNGEREDQAPAAKRPKQIDIVETLSVLVNDSSKDEPTKLSGASAVVGNTAPEGGQVLEKNTGDGIVAGNYSVFVKNIDFSVTQEDLENVFKASKYTSGASEEIPTLVVRLSKSAAGKSRGMAHVDFWTPELRDQALRLHNTVLKGRPMTVEKFVPSAYATAEHHPSTIFVTHMSRDTSEKNLRSFLEGLMAEQGQGQGQKGDMIEAVKIMKCKRSGNSKGQALVQFKSAHLAAEVITALTNTQKQLDGKKLAVTRSKFPAIMESPSSSGPSSASRSSNATVAKAAATSTTKGSTSSFKPRRLAVRPASVKVKAANKSSLKDSGPISFADSAPDKEQHQTAAGSAKSNSDFRKFFQ